MTTRAPDRVHQGRLEEDGPDVADLVWRLRANERSALAEVYDRHHEVLRRFALRLLGDPTAAEDLVHDVFLSLPRTMKRFEGRSTLRSFLLSVAVNRCKHHVRAAIRYRKAKERFGQQEPPPVRGPAERYRQKELAHLMARGLDELPLDQRVAFVLTAIEEHTSREAAKIAGVPEATIRTRAMRARQKLRAFLEQENVR